MYLIRAEYPSREGEEFGEKKSVYNPELTSLREWEV